MGLFKCRIVWERDTQVSLEAARYISISVLFSNVDLFTFVPLCLFKFSLEQVIQKQVTQPGVFLKEIIIWISHTII